MTLPLLMKPLMFNHEGCTLMTLSNSNHLPKAPLNTIVDGFPPFNTSHWWLNCSTWTLGRYIQAIVVWNISGGIHMNKKLETLVATREEYWVAGDRVKVGHYWITICSGFYTHCSDLSLVFDSFIQHLFEDEFRISAFILNQPLRFYLSTRQSLPRYWANPLNLLKDISVQSQAQWYMPVSPMT